MGVGGLLAIAGVGGDPVSLLCDARVSGGLRGPVVLGVGGLLAIAGLGGDPV